MIDLIIIAISSVIFLRLDRFKQFCIVSLATFFPLCIGDLGSIRNLLVIEWLIPIFFLFTMNEFLPLRNEGKLITFDGIRTFIFAIAIIIIWIIQSYVNNQLLSDTVTIGSQTGIRRLYYGVISKATLFFTVIVFLYKNINEIDIEKWLKILIYFSLAFGIIRAFAYFIGFNTPLLAGTFDYNPGGRSIYGGVAYRIGGLSDVAIIGTSALLARYHLTKKISIFYSALFLGFLFLSGGRTALVGLTLAVVIYSIFFLKKYLIYIIATCIITISIIFIVAPDRMLQGQFGRLSAFQGGMQKQDKGRFMTYMLSIDNFKNNPIFGKGLKEYEGYISASNEEDVNFIREQLFAGGHGSYITILGTFGLGGIVYLCLMIFGGIILSFKKIRDYFDHNPYLTAIATFTFIILITKSVVYITEQNGISDPSLFFLTGLISSIRVLENKEIITRE